MKTALEKGILHKLNLLGQLLADVNFKVDMLKIQLKKQEMEDLEEYRLEILKDFAEKIEKQGLEDNNLKSKHLVIWNYEWKQLKKQEGLK